jgi:hypothetical protein
MSLMGCKQPFTFFKRKSTWSRYRPSANGGLLEVHLCARQRATVDFSFAEEAKVEIFDLTAPQPRLRTKDRLSALGRAHRLIDQPRITLASSKLDGIGLQNFEMGGPSPVQAHCHAKYDAVVSINRRELLGMLNESKQK